MKKDQLCSTLQKLRLQDGKFMIGDKVVHPAIGDSEASKLRDSWIVANMMKIKRPKGSFNPDGSIFMFDILCYGCGNIIRVGMERALAKQCEIRRLMTINLINRIETCSTCGHQHRFHPVEKGWFEVLPEGIYKTPKLGLGITLHLRGQPGHP